MPSAPPRPHTPWAVVALGANLGDPGAAVEAALGRIAARFPDGFTASSLWTSTPVDCPPGSPTFINAVAAFHRPPGLGAEAFLDWSQALEREFGRGPKRVHNEARPLDLDLIAWGDLRHESARLTLPHPRAHLRRFVLEPLAEILPGLVLPGQARPVVGLLAALETPERLRRLRGPVQRPAADSGSMSGV